jgi:hypothetical protein
LVDQADIVLKLEGGKITEIRRGPATAPRVPVSGPLPATT